ncbi:MAG: fumarylacetoacetate hydrolase family protein [Chloroflexi bacterium]|nr:fumarylacetoacetate hydrolase family protein [Chloroflexota bacterium]
MRLVAFRAREDTPTGEGARRLGAVVTRDHGDVVLDLTALDPTLPTDLVDLLAQDALDRSRSLVAGAGPETPTHPIADVRLLAPIATPPKILAAAGNYQEHLVEGGAPRVDPARVVPRLFLKPTSTIIGPDEPFRLSPISRSIDWELELAAVVGRRCRDVAMAEALDVVAGYTIVNDISARSMEWGLADRQPSDWNGFFDWLNGKWLDGSAPLGPWFVTADEIPDPQALVMELRVNGEVRQSADTSQMIFGVAELVAFASRFLTLEPGDIIATGTPAGVGATTGTFLADGDVMEATIEGLGTLVTPVVAG